jgi:hypothetical protein
LEREWIRRARKGRQVFVSNSGRAAFAQFFSLTTPGLTRGPRAAPGHPARLALLGESDHEACRYTNQHPCCLSGELGAPTAACCPCRRCRGHRQSIGHSRRQRRHRHDAWPASCGIPRCRNDAEGISRARRTGDRVRLRSRDLRCLSPPLCPSGEVPFLPAAERS